MNTIKVKDLMVPLKEYATVSVEATLLEAVLSLEKAQMTLDPSRYKHRAILVLNESGNVVSKITMKDILSALEPNYGKIEGIGVLERSGYSPDMIQSMLADHALWTEPLQFFGERAANLKVSDFIQAPSECEYIDGDATLREVIHRLIVCPYFSLLVTSGDAVVGIVRLSDVFEKICGIIKEGQH
jgi:CBS domain-containing protein